MCFKDSYAVRLMSLVVSRSSQREFKSITRPRVKHEPTPSQALICYFLLFLSFMATEKQV